MDILENPYYTLTKYVIIATGQSPYHPKWLKFLIKSYYSFVILSCSVGQIVGLTEIYGDIDLVLECIPPLCFASISIIILINNNVQEKQMILVFSKMQSDWKTLTSKHDAYVLCKYAKRSKFYNAFYLVGFLGNLTVFLFSRTIFLLIYFLNDSYEIRPVLAIVDFGIDPEKYYYWISIHLHLCAYLGSVLTISGTMIFTMLIEHACGIFEIIGHKLTIALEEYQNQSNELIFKKKFQREIILCVRMHRRVLSFVNDIQKLFSTAYFFIFGFCIVDLSITGVQAVMNLDNAREATRYGLHSVAQILNILFLTFPTQHLIDTSTCISDCIYSASWYHLTSENQKWLLIIMRRGAEPTKLVVGRVFILSLEFFKKVLQTSVSYFTVLMAVRQ
ncbi:uncharacterized protein LOC127289310 [Leptopilina boulardi]|uniref:uncharacterized protein LOC127289310 n=1 Tax=Leptopilina boulardi TaxID=63433 RepID=UPI0021F63F60|nr:uncharacterized protein LOC127289310 [Leptopilina boulardi]